MYIQFGIQKLNGVYKRLHRCLYGVTTIPILSISFVVLCYFIPSTEYSFAVNTTSNLLSSSIKVIVTQSILPELKHLGFLRDHFIPVYNHRWFGVCQKAP